VRRPPYPLAIAARLAIAVASRSRSRTIASGRARRTRSDLGKALAASLVLLGATAGLAACGGSSDHAPGGAANSASGGADPTAPPAAIAAKAGSSAKSLRPGVVATVAGAPITIAQYRQVYGAHFHALTADGIPLDPPSFGRCATSMGRQLARSAQQRSKATDRHRRAPKLPTPSHAQLVEQCRSRLAGIKQSAMAQLIQQRWVAGEARAEGVSVSDASVNAALARQQRALGGAAAYERYLARTGRTPRQMAGALRETLTEQRLQQRRLGPPITVTDQQVAAYFDAHKAAFELPHQPTPQLSQYEARIRMLLASQARARRAASATLAFERRWRALTICAPAYVVQLCANAPH
jgi:SurA-like protein